MMRKPHPFLAALSAALAVSAPAFAQSQPGRLTAVQVEEGPSGDTRVILSFDPLLPQFAIDTNDIARPMIGFGAAVRAADVVAPPGRHGPLKAVRFRQRDTVLIIEFVGARRLHLRTIPVAGRQVVVVVTAAPTAGTVPGR